MAERFQRVDSNLFRGGEPSLDDLRLLKNLGIKTIISLDGDIGSRIHNAVLSLGFKHIILPLTDGNGNNLEKLPILVNSISDKTYVHCRYGKDRTGLFVALYRVLKNGWSREMALKEAYNIGMGSGLDPQIGKSYYNAFDELSVDDAVTESRDYGIQLAPSINDSQVPNFSQFSFAPFLDVEVDHLNRPASVMYRINELRKFAGVGTVFRYSYPHHLLQSALWTDDAAHAKKLSEHPHESKMFSAQISPGADIEFTLDRFSETAVRAAMLKGKDVVVFNPHNGPVEYYVINPGVLININLLEDDNYVPLIGQHDNYTGLVPYSLPGSGSVMPQGGAAGFIQLPQGQM